MNFKIHKIHYGWFEIEFDEKFIITNSDFMGCDAPLLLIEGLNNLLKKSSNTEWLCWQDEPGACILSLSESNNKFMIEIFDSKLDSTELAYSGNELALYIDKKIYTASGNIKDFGRQVVSEFYKYSQGNMLKSYEKHWGGFPLKQLKELELLLATI